VVQDAFQRRKELIVLQDLPFLPPDYIEALFPLVPEDGLLDRPERLLEVVEINRNERPRIDPVGGIGAAPVKAERFREQGLP
jgi:hypothetical protein